MNYKILVTLFTKPVAVFLFSFVNPLWAETDRQACYGETLEVSMPVSLVEGNNGEYIATDRVVFALPFPDAWYITVKDKGELYQLPCLEEPLASSRVWGGFMDARLGQGNFNIPDIENIAFSSIRLTSSTPQTFERREKIWHEDALKKGVLTEDGFVHYVGENTGAIDGVWLFPEHYLSPVGTRIRIGCALQCEVMYRIQPGLQLTYKLRVLDESVAPPWIEIDEYVRSVVLDWIMTN